MLTCLYTHIHTCVHTYIHKIYVEHTYTCTPLYMYIPMNKCLYIYIYIFTYIYIYVYMCTPVYLYFQKSKDHIYICLHIYNYISTYLYSLCHSMFSCVVCMLSYPFPLSCPSCLSMSFRLGMSPFVMGHQGVPHSLNMSVYIYMCVCAP